MMRARKMLCLSRNVVADRLDISPSTYAAYELDKRKPPIERLCEIAKILRVSPNYLLDCHDTQSSDEQRILSLVKKIAVNASENIRMTMEITELLSRKAKQ